MEGLLVTKKDDDLEAQAEIVKEIKKNIATLKLSVDNIIDDMNTIKDTRNEILEKFAAVKNENICTDQILMTLGKATQIMKKSEDNRRRLEVVMKKMNEFNVIHTIENPDDSNHADVNGNMTLKCSEENGNIKNMKSLVRNGPSHEKIILHLLENKKYMLNSINQGCNGDGSGKEKPDFKKGKESALKELHWIVKMKIYRFRHRYDKLQYDYDLGERTPLPVAWKRASEHA